MTSIYPAKKRAPEKYVTEFDILKSAHRFLRDNNDPRTAKSWDAQLAKKYEDSLFKEFAVCDLKHFKSGNVALRWRTEDEVLSGAGENTCGNVRCPYHQAEAPQHKPPKFTTLELPFAYAEQGETEIEMREAMVKVVLCSRCTKKIMWKREQDKKTTGPSFSSGVGLDDDKEEEGSSHSKKKEKRRERSPERRHHRPRSRSKSPPRRR